MNNPFTVTVTPTISNFLEEKKTESNQISEHVKEFNKLLLQRQNPTTRSDNYRYSIEYFIKTTNTQYNELIFQVVREEYFMDIDNKFQVFNKSIICDYSLAFRFRDKQNQWVVTDGNLTTYPGGPSKGFWSENTSEPFNYKKGWASLLFHIATMAVSILKMDREALLVHEGSRAIYKKYYQEPKFATLVKQRDNFMKVLFHASNELTLKAQGLVMEWLEHRSITFGTRRPTIAIN